jgi:hypothetical protein
MEVSGQLHAPATLLREKEPLRAVLDAVVKRKIHNLLRKSNPRTPDVQPVAQRYTTELSRLHRQRV